MGDIAKTSVILLRRRRALAAPSIETERTGAAVCVLSAALQAAQVTAPGASSVWRAGKNLAETASTTAAAYVGTNLPAGVTLTFSIYVSSAVGGNVRARLQYSAGGSTQYITGAYTGAGAWSVASGAIPAGATNIQAYVQRQAATSSFLAENIQVEIGATRTAYEVYKGKTEGAPGPVLLVPGYNSVWSDAESVTLNYRRYGWQGV